MKNKRLLLLLFCLYLIVKVHCHCRNLSKTAYVGSLINMNGSHEELDQVDLNPTAGLETPACGKVCHFPWCLNMFIFVFIMKFLVDNVFRRKINMQVLSINQMKKK